MRVTDEIVHYLAVGREAVAERIIAVGSLLLFEDEHGIDVGRHLLDPAAFIRLLLRRDESIVEAHRDPGLALGELFLHHDCMAHRDIAEFPREALHLVLAIGEEPADPRLAHLEFARHARAEDSIDLTVFEFLWRALALAQLDPDVGGRDVIVELGLARDPNCLLGRQAVVILKNAAEHEIDGETKTLEPDALADEIAWLGDRRIGARVNKSEDRIAQ